MTIENRKLKIKNGFSLIEMVVYMGVFSVIMLILTNLFINTLDLKVKNEANSTVSQDGRFVLSKIMNDINNANSVSYPSLGSSASSLNFVLYGTAQTYQLNNGNLELINNYGTSVLNSVGSKVTNLVFTRLGNAGGRNSVQVQFTLESISSVNGNKESISFQTTVGLR